MTPTDDRLSPLERFRSYLLLLARRQVGERPGRLEASDLVQQTLLEAWRDQERFRGETAGQQAAWLRQILARNLADAERAQHRDCRDVRRDRSLQADLDGSSAHLAALLAEQGSSPSRRLDRDEQAVRLAQALEA